MATINSMQKCINLASKETQERLPESVQKALKAGRADLLLAALESHEQRLKTLQKEIVSQHQKIRQDTLDTLPASRFTSRNNDPDNELNQFQPKGGLRVLLENLVQRAGNLYQAAKRFIVLSKAERAVVEDFSFNFLPAASQAIDSIFAAKEGADVSFRYRDMVQYFMDRYSLDTNKALDPVVKEALSATIYEWLGNDARRTGLDGQTKDSLRALLGWDKDAPISNAVWEALSDLGTNNQVLAQQLGRTILDRLSLRTKDSADALAQERMEYSLGLLALATLEKMQYIRRQEVHAKALDTLRKGLSLEDQPVYYTEEQGTREGLLLLNSTVLQNTEENLARVQEIEDKLALAEDVFDKLFNNDPNQQRYSFTKITLPSRMTAGRSFLPIAKKQRENLQKYTDTVWEASETGMGIFESMLALIDDTEATPEMVESFYALLGKETMEGKLKIRQKSIEGQNRDIERDLRNIQKWLAQAKAKNTRKFYIPNKFMSTMRMLMQGHVNPQNSKMMRALFVPESWKTSFVPDYQVRKFANKTGLERSFLAAVAQALDIESGKKGGVGAQLQALDDLLNYPDRLSTKDRVKRARLWEAIYALQEYDQTKKMTPELMYTISLGVQATEMKLHGFKGLYDYARYLNYKKMPAKQRENRPFTSDLYKEIDGVSNGTVLSMLMFLKGNMKDTLAALAMGGISVSRLNANLDEYLGPKYKYFLDGYQRMGQAWALELERLKSEARDNDDQLQLIHIQAAEHIMGSFHKEGLVTSIVRSLSKGRTIQINYGAGLQGQSKILADGDVIYNGIYTKLEEIIAEAQKDEFQAERLGDTEIKENLHQLFQSINALLQQDSKRTVETFRVEQYLNEDGSFNIEKLLDFKLEKAQIAKVEEAIKNTYGTAMEKAATSVYGSMLEARKPFLQAVATSVALYNALLEAKVKRVLETKVQTALENFKAQNNGNLSARDEKAIRASKKYNQITKAELKQIQQELEGVLPKIPTPQHTEEDPSFLQLVSSGKQKKYLERSETDKVTQLYKPGTLVRQHGYPAGIPFLDTPGVAPLVRAIQMLDSMIANYLMGLDVDILNAHDGFSHSIKDSDFIGEEANKELYRIIETYSLAEKLSEMYQANWEAAKTLLKEEQIGADVLFSHLVQEGSFTAQDLIDFLDLDKADKKILYGTIAEYQKASKKEKAMERAFRDMLGRHKVPLQQVMLAHFRKVGKEVDSMGSTLANNQKELAAHITRVAQYSNGGLGFDPQTTDRESRTVFGYERDSFPFSDIETVQGMVQETHALAQEALQGSSDAGQNMLLQQQNYPTTESINALNVSQVFETMAAQDERAEFGSVRLSPDHKNHLIRVLDKIVSKVMEPVRLFVGTHQVNAETQGVYDADGKSIWIQLQQTSTLPQSGMLGQGIRMSAAEVYAHELSHHIMAFGLKHSTYLRNKAYDLYEFVRDTLEAKYGDTAFRVFLNNPSMDINDPNNAYEVEAAKARWKYIFEPAQRADRSNPGVAEFLAFGLTNENFKRELSWLTTPPKKANKALFGIFEKNVQQTVLNLFNKIMDFIHTQFYKQQHSTKVDQELENLVIALSQVDSRAKSSVYAGFVKASTAITDAGNQVDTLIKETVNKTLATRPVGILLNNLKELPEANNYLSYQMRRALNWYGDKHGKATFLQAVVSEMQGATGRLQTFHDMLNRRKRDLDAAKVEAADNIRKAVNDRFKRELSAQEKTVYTEVGLKTDLSYLIDRRTAATLIRLVEDSKTREAEIDALLLRLQEDPTLQPYLHYFQRAADDLGYFMIHSVRRNRNAVPFMNAHNIVAMKNAPPHIQRLEGDALAKALNIVEELATLSSLRYVPETERYQMASMMNEDWEAFETVMYIHQQLKREALQNSFFGNPGKMQKGYIKQILNDRIRFTVGTLADKVELTRQGYTMEGRPLKRDPDDLVKEDIYLYRSLTGTINDYQSGIASLTSNTKKGQDLYQNQQQIGNTATARAEGLKNTQRMIGNMERQIARMFLPGVPHDTNVEMGTNYLVPHFTDDGAIAGFRYMMSEHSKKTVLQQFGEVDAVLGAMASQNIDKKVTPVINQELVEALKAFYDAEYEKHPEDFIEVSPYSPDQELRELYYRLPDAMRKAVKSVWKRDGMRVSRDMLTLVFGQEKYSFIEFLQKNSKYQQPIMRSVKEIAIFALGWDNPFSRNPLGTQKQDSLQERRDKRAGRAVIRAKRIEETMEQLTKYAKSNIVVRNLKVIHGNYLSNIALLLSHDVPIHDILRGSKEAVNSALAYQVLNSRYQQMRIQRQVLEVNQRINAVDKAAQLKALDRSIMRLEDELARNLSKSLIDAGLMPSIVDDVDTAHIESPYTYGVDKALNTVLDKMPAPMAKVSKVLFMTQDTEGFRMMNNAVKMTDYVGRYILYQHLTKKQGMSSEEAVRSAKDLFINFDLPTHKSLEYLNSIGLIFFSKYQLRVLKHIKNVVKDAPFSTLAVYILGQFAGINENIINSIPGVTKGLTQNLSTPWNALSSSTGQILYLDLATKIATAPVM